MVQPEDEKSAYERSRSIGMTFMQRFIVEEDSQFELFGIYNIRDDSSGRRYDRKFNREEIRKAVKKYAQFIKQPIQSEV